MAETTVYDQCGPRIIDVSNSCDGSLSKADITALTPGQLVTLKDHAYEEAFLYRQALLARMAGVREFALWDLIMSRVQNVKGQLIRANLRDKKSFFMPYILREQRDHINANAFVIESGVISPNAGATVGGITYPAHAWEITVKGTDSPWYTTIEKLERYFLAKETVVVLNLSATNAVEEPYYEVLTAVNADAGGVPKAKVTIIPNVTAATYAGLPAAAQAVYEVERGVVLLGANNVSDYETWCHNQPVDLSARMIAFWPQTSRFTRCWDDEYEKFLNYIFEGKVNPYLEKFKELPMSEQNRQMFATYQRKFMNSFWFGQTINENQTIEGYKNLPQINDPKKANVFLEYKANALGVRTQLSACNRVVDYAGAALDFNVLEESLYQLKRHREVDGGTVEEIDCMTDKGTANRIKSLMAKYYQARYGMSWGREFAGTQKVEFGQQTLWRFNQYEFDGAHVLLNVYVEPFFADFKTHFPTALKSRGNMLLMPDWQDIVLGIAETDGRNSHTPDLETDPDFACIIKANITHYEMESTRWTPIIESPDRHLIIENFSDACPSFKYEACEATAS